jgi:hypothetical protein
MINSYLYRYGCHLSIAMINAKNFFSYIDRYLLLALKGLLRKGICLPSCIKTTPRTRSEASVSTTNCELKSSSAKTRVVDSAAFNLSNAN